MLKRRSAFFVILLEMLFILGAFALLSIKNERFDVVAVIAGVVIAFYNLMFYVLIRRIYRHIDRFVLLPAQILWSIGLVVLYRIDKELALRQFIFILAGTLILLAAMWIVRRSGDFGKYNWLFMAIGLVLLIAPYIFGRTVGGAKNWIHIGPISFQPSEPAKVLYIAISAYFLSTRHELKQFIPYVLFTAACVVVLVVEKDLGTALMIAGTFLIMFFAATGRLLLTLAGVGVLGGGAVASYFLFSHVRTRVAIWQDPWSSYNSSGYQVVQGLIAFASGGLLGTGLGRGMPQAVPARHTDYIFSVIGEEFGIIVAAMVILFYLLFIVRGILIAFHANSTFDALLVFGATVMLSLQSFVIIGGVIKLIPLTGVTMPFVSYGGSSIISSMALLGVIEGVAEKNGRREERELMVLDADLGGESA